MPRRPVFLNAFGLRPRGQPEAEIFKIDGEAEPRLTSGGKAEVDGVKFQNRVLIFKTVSHIRRRSRNDTRHK